MSSDKRRLRLRVKRLQQMFQSLGKDPNAKEYEVKSLTMDFDKVVRKQLARLKKAKQQRLQTRQEILLVYGLKSRERITIDEEIQSMMKNFEADMKRLRAIMQNYEEKKSDITEQEKKERTEVITMTKDCFNNFKFVFNEQTTRFEKGLYNDRSVLGEGPSMNETNVSRIMHDNETQQAFFDEPSARYIKNDFQQVDFDQRIFNVLTKLEQIEKKWVLGEFDSDEVVIDAYAVKFENFDKTVSQIRKPAHAFFDIFLIIAIVVLVTLALQLLKMKGIISNYHFGNIPT